MNYLKSYIILFLSICILALLFWYENVSNVYSPFFIVVGLLFLVLFAICSSAKLNQVKFMFIVLILFQIIFVSLAVLMMFKDYISMIILLVNLVVTVLFGAYLIRGNVTFLKDDKGVDIKVDDTHEYYLYWIIPIILPILYYVYRRQTYDSVFFLSMLVLILVGCWNNNSSLSTLLVSLTVVYFLTYAVYIGNVYMKLFN